MQMQSLNKFEQECPTTKNKGQNKEPSWLNRLNSFGGGVGVQTMPFFCFWFFHFSRVKQKDHTVYIIIRWQCLLQKTEIDNAVWSVLEL